MDSAVFELDCELDVIVRSGGVEDMHDFPEPSR
jgi:hypothetical protein